MVMAVRLIPAVAMMSLAPAWSTRSRAQAMPSVAASIRQKNPASRLWPGPPGLTGAKQWSSWRKRNLPETGGAAFSLAATFGPAHLAQPIAGGPPIVSLGVKLVNHPVRSPASASLPGRRETRAAPSNDIPQHSGGPVSGNHT